MDKIKKDKIIKITVVVIAIVSILIAITVLILNVYINTDSGKIMKGNSLYGNTSTCNGKCNRSNSAGDMMAPYQCEICGGVFRNSNTDIPKLCGNCSQITNRHDYCGSKLLQKN